MEGENIGDWLYFIFLIIAGISSLFSSKNKKKRPKSVSTQPNEEEEVIPENTEGPQKGIWDILQEIQESQSDPVPQPVVTPQKKQIKNRETQPCSHQNRFTHQPKEEETKSFDIELNHAEELRKAVIYAEILNRKY